MLPSDMDDLLDFSFNVQRLLVMDLTPSPPPLADFRVGFGVVFPDCASADLRMLFVFNVRPISSVEP